jgi:MFS family permease
MSKQIEFYKNRSIGERFSVAIDFLKQNWKALYKNILIGGLPLSIILGFILPHYSTMQQRIMSGDFSLSSTVFLLLAFFLFSFLLTIYMYAMTGTFLRRYEQGELTEQSGRNDFGLFFQLAGKTFIISLLVFLPVLLCIAFIGFLFFSLIPLAVLLVFLLFGSFIAVAPALTIIYFPAFFSGKKNWESVKIAFRLGFKNWGSLFVSLILAGIVAFVVGMIFSLPYQVLAFLSPDYVSTLMYVFSIFSQMATLLTTPVLILIFAFQYFSITEKEEGVSLQAQVDEFENL